MPVSAKKAIYLMRGASEPLPQKERERSPVAISGHQRPSAAISGHQRPSAAISGHQWPSAAISGHQRPSAYTGSDESRRMRRKEGRECVKLTTTNPAAIVITRG